MNNNKYIKEKIILYFLKFFIIGVFTGALYYVWTEYYNPYIPTPFFKLGNYLLGAVFAAVYVWFVKVYGGFQVGTSPVVDLVFSQVISVGFVTVVCYVIFSLLSYRLVSLWPFIVMFIVFAIIAAAWSVFTDFVYYKLHTPRKTVVVFGNIDSYLSLKGIKSMDKRFTVLHTYNYEKTSLSELFEKIRPIEAVFLCGVPSDYRNEVVKYCIAHGKIAYVKPKISDTIIRGGKTIQLMNVPVYRCKRSANSLGYQVLKRFFDVVLSLIAIVISSPIMLATAIAIKAYDGGDVFYRQVRLTTNGKRFRIFKFRSMIQMPKKTVLQGLQVKTMTESHL